MGEDWFQKICEPEYERKELNDWLKQKMEEKSGG